MDSNVFDLVLDNDEKVIEILKPNKTKFMFDVCFIMFFSLLILLTVALVGMFVPEEGYEPVKPIFALIPIGIAILIFVFVIWLERIKYKNTFYTYTNKRIIIRTGIFGVDYKSLDICMIGALDVTVSLFDKILRKNTGTLKFGSTSSPINSQTGMIYSFSQIEKPYETYKKLKAHFDAVKLNNK